MSTSPGELNTLKDQHAGRVLRPRAARETPSGDCAPMEAIGTLGRQQLGRGKAAGRPREHEATVAQPDRRCGLTGVAVEDRNCDLGLEELLARRLELANADLRAGRRRFAQRLKNIASGLTKRRSTFAPRAGGSTTLSRCGPIPTLRQDARFGELPAAPRTDSPLSWRAERSRDRRAQTLAAMNPLPLIEIAPPAPRRPLAATRSR
jgi:hypothetical protein